ncbi:MAG: gliding motility-associated C-terminal domain-containing protein [Bacteroidales bacterium]|jgi:gliding motility-associated-like protein|nr:gliding motility-associated C-terminal domain-containing protein [Bacteroidales bacterium]
MWRYSFIFGILLGSLFKTEAVGQQIDFYCTQTDTAGNISFSWQPTGIPSGYQYELYSSLSRTAPFTLVATLSSALTSYTDAGAGGNFYQVFYVVKAVPIPPATGTEYCSDTIGSIRLILNNLGTGIITLDWTHPYAPPADTSGEFIVYRQRNGGWTTWAKTKTLTFTDTIHVCGETIAYEVRLSDNAGCDHVSSKKEDFLSDLISPSTPQLDSVSINPATGKTELGWNRGVDSDIVGYIVYILSNGIWKIVDTVMGATNTHFIDTVNNANDSVRQYRIAAIDTCRNSSPMGAVHNTMLLNASTTKCDSMASLSWNPYNGMPDNVTGYRILVSENGGVFQFVDTVPFDRQTYIHQGLDPMKIYIYCVQAYNSVNGYSATSSKKEVRFNRTVSSGNVWLRYVSVVNNKDIEVAVFVEDTVDYQNIVLFRSDNNGVTFSQTDAKAKTAGVENYFFTDDNVDVQAHTYLYTAAITDECDHVFVYSDTANNIVLQPDGSIVDQIAIAWEPYDGFDQRLDSYDVLRKTQTDTVFRLADNVSASQLNYSENVWSIASEGGRFYYQVSANEDNTNQYGFQDKSYSNVVEITKSPLTFIPNIFAPNSPIAANRIFKPVHSYVDANEYLFSIFDRWGNLVFRTNDIQAGWDGTVQGKSAMTGVYVYSITYRIDKKNIFVTQGYVTLIW